MATIELTHHPVRVSPGRRFPQLFGGLALYGVSVGMQIEGVLGLSPWDVLNDAVHKLTGMSYGTASAVISVLVLLCWIPLRQRPGIGTVANVLVISVMVDVTLWLIPDQHGWVARISLMVGGIVLNALATAAYIGVWLGPGPRDGLMTGLAKRTGYSIRLVRTAIEVLVLALGWLLGGTVGIGTALYALGIGPLTQAFLPLVSWHPRQSASSELPAPTRE